jgi:hypothetical protein
MVSATLRHLRENVRLVREQDHRIVGSDACQRAGQIVDAFKRARAKPISDLVAEASEPETAAGRPQQDRFVFHDRQAHSIKRAPHAVDVVPPVVIAKNCIDAERRVQARQFRRPDRMRHTLGDEMMGGKKIAEHNGEIAAEFIGGIDHLPHAVETHVGASSVQIGDDRDREALSFRPGRR